VGSMKKSQKLVAEKKFMLWIIGAAAMHAFVLFLVLYLQIWDSGRHVKPKIVSVTLVSMPGTEGSAPQENSSGVSSISSGVNNVVTPPVPEKAQPALPKPVAVEVPRKISAEPLKPKVVEKQPDIKSALERLKQTVEKKTASLPQTSTGNLSKALANLQQKVNSDNQHAGTVSGSGRSSSSNGRGGTGNGSGGGGTAEPYKAEIASIIQQNWVFSKQLLKNSYGMSVYVRINIISDGTIRQIVFDKRSPSEYLNNSVKKALEKSSPLPVPPKEDGSREVWIGFMFTPEGIE
jgi:colicin import membrane protein